MIRKTLLMIICSIELVVTLFTYNYAYSEDSQSSSQDTSVNSMYRLAIDFNDSINQCIQTKCSNIDHLMGYFADDAIVINPTGETERGKTSIRKGVIRRMSRQPDVSNIIRGFDVWDQMIICRVEVSRQFTVGKYKASELSHQVDTLVMKNGKIIRWVTVTSGAEK